MEIYNIYKPFSPPEKDSPIYLQPPRLDQPTSKNPSFLRQSNNSIENYLVQPSKESNPYISEKTSSIPELKDLNQERTLSRLKSRNSSNSKSPKNNLNFNGNVQGQGNFLKDLESQWKNLKDDHHNFLSHHDKKNSFISNINERDDIQKQDRSISPSKLLNFNNQTMDENSRLENNKYLQNSEKKITSASNNLLTPNKFLKKSVPHSKINLELCKKILNNNPVTNSERNTPEKFSKDRGIEKREYSPCINPTNHQITTKDNQQHFKLILNKYANIYKKNIEIDLTPLNNNKSNNVSKNISHKISSEDDKKSLNNSKVSTNTGKSENIKKNGGLLEKILDNKLRVASHNSQNCIKNIEPEKITSNVNDKINEKLRKINTTKIYLKEDDISMDIPSENKDLDLAKKQITQSPQYFNKKHCFGSSNQNPENFSSKNDKFNKSFIENSKKCQQTPKERDSLKSNQSHKPMTQQSHTPKKEVVNKIPYNTSMNEKIKSKEYGFKQQNEMNNDKNAMDASDRRSKNNNKDIPLHYHLNTEKENLDLEKMQASYLKNNSNRYFADNLSSSLENKKIIDSLYKNCIEEKPLETPNLSKNLINKFDEKEKDFIKKLNYTSDESKLSSFAFSIPNGESIIGFPFVENNEKISFSMKNFSKPNVLDYKTNLDDEKKLKNNNYFYEASKVEKAFEVPKKNPEFLFTFNNGREEKGYSLLNEKILSSEKYCNLK